MSRRSAVETAETAVVVRVLRSGVKLAQQPGRIVTTSSTWYPPSPSPSLLKSESPTPASLRDSPGPFNFGVRFTWSSQVFGQSDWEYSIKYRKLYVDVDTWVSVLCDMEDFTGSRTEFQVRVTASTSSSYLPFHLVRLAGASLSSYQQDRQGRHSVVFPVSSSAAACRKIKFAGLSSDLGQEEVMVVFSLEDGEGQLVGRRVFTVKIRTEQSVEKPISEF